MHEHSSITYIGHATLLLEVDGVHILTDPLLRNHITGFIRRQTSLPPLPSSAIDLVLISHLHFDHFDLPSLRSLGRDTHIAVPKGTAAYLRRNGFRQVSEMSVGDTIKVESVEIEATPANHTGRRAPFRPAADCLGYVIRGKSTVYFAGDTDIFPEMHHYASNLDVALMPVWGWGPTLGRGHLDPERAAEALTMLRPRLAMPIHWGTFFPIGMNYSHGHLLSEPPQLFAQHAQRVAPDVKVKILAPGETLHGVAETSKSSDKPLPGRHHKGQN